MTQGAELPLPRCKWLRRKRIFGVNPRGSMTRFTRKILVKSLLPHLCYIFMALATDGRTGEFHLFRHLSLYGRFSMKSRLYERGRQYKISEDYCPSDDEGKDNCESSYLFRNSFEHRLYLLSHGWI